MDYLVLRSVIIDGKRYPPGDVVQIKHDLVHRLVALGYIQQHTPDLNDRSVGLETSTVAAPKRRGRPRKSQ